MAFQRPTLSELVTRIERDFIARLELQGSVLRRSMIYVMVRVIAGAVHMLYGFAEFIAKQIFPDKSDEAFLVRQAGVFGITPTPATYAQGTVLATGVDSVLIAAGTVLVRSDGATYTVDDEATISSGEAELQVTAALAGADYTLAEDMELVFQSPITDVDATATVTENTSDGTDVEATEAFRARFLSRLAAPPMGGSAADYVAWALEVPGVTRAWFDALALGPNHSVLRFVRDNDVSPIPDSGEVATVQAYIDARKPAHAELTVVAPVEVSQNLTLSITPDNSTTRAAVTAEMNQLMKSQPPGGVLLVSSINTACGTAAGLTDYTVISPSIDVGFGDNELPKLGTITWA